MPALKQETPQRLISLREAREKNLVHFFHGRPCKRGHISKRFTASQSCCECTKSNYAKDPKNREKKRLAYWREGGREDRRARNLKRNYGITLERYDAMAALQNDRCAICEAPAARRLVVDHCHRTDQIRALLCTTCNLGLGAFTDSPEKLAKAIKYLKRHGRS